MMGIKLGLVASGRPAEAFTPLALANRKAWYRSDSLVAGAVSAWPDISGTGDSAKNLAQASAGLRPVCSAADATFNGHNSVLWDATDDALPSGTWAVPLAQPYYTFAVFRANDAGSGSDYIFDSTNTGARGSLFIEQDGNHYLYAFGGGGGPLTASLAGISSLRAVLTVFNGASSRMHRNSKTGVAISGGSIGTATIPGVTLGNYAGGGTFAFNGRIAEAYWGSGDPSVGDVSDIFDYLSSRYTITLV
jgi:hypothetical protein